MIKKIVFCFVILSANLFAQMSDLEIMPRHINYWDYFHRMAKIQVFNRSNENIKIDSLVYDSSILFVTNNFGNFPIEIRPWSSIYFNVRLLEFNIANNDTSSTIKIYNSGNQAIYDILVSVKFNRMRRMTGEISGTVGDSLGVIPEAKIYFFLGGNLLADSTYSNLDGMYSKELPVGDYFVSAMKTGYYMQYGNLKNSPLEADLIEVRKDRPQILDFILEHEVNTDYSIKGVVIDIISELPLQKAVVVSRKGKHNPTKIADSTNNNLNRSYTVMTNSKGEFNIQNIQHGGDYYLEAFSQFHLPGYFNHMNQVKMFWQDADSLSIWGNETNKNIYLDRDSSYGGGLAGGRIHFDSPDRDSTGGAVIYAISTQNDRVYHYNFSQSSGKFGINDLPYGVYKLKSDKIGFENSMSSEFAISESQDSLLNIDLLLTPTSVERKDPIATNFSLAQNYPNPFNPSTTIEFTIISDGLVVLSVYDILGRKIGDLVNGFFSTGTYKVNFNSTLLNTNLTSGIYFYQLKSSGQSIVRKMQLLK